MSAVSDFLRTGSIGPIRPGATEAEVVDALGQPHAVSVRNKPRVANYGPIQLAYFRSPDQPDRVASMSLYPAHGGRVSGLDVDTLPKTRAAVTAALAAAGVQPVAERREPVDEIELPSGVRLVFDGDQLHSVHVRLAAPVPQAETKQLSVILPLSTFRALQELARRRQHGSVQELVASVLENETKSGEK
jgi:hypothetical protein